MSIVPRGPATAGEARRDRVPARRARRRSGSRGRELDDDRQELGARHRRPRAEAPRRPLGRARRRRRCTRAHEVVRRPRDAPRGTNVLAPMCFRRSRAMAADESACKPDSVPDLAARARPSFSGCRCRQPLAAYPQARTGRPLAPAQVGGRSLRPFWPCSGWGLPSRPSHLGRWWSLTPPFHPYRLAGRNRRPGGLFSVALSRGSPRVGVTHHPALWSPDFPRRGPEGSLRDRPAGSSAVRLTLSAPRRFRGIGGASMAVRRPRGRRAGRRRRGGEKRREEKRREEELRSRRVGRFRRGTRCR